MLNKKPHQRVLLWRSGIKPIKINSSGCFQHVDLLFLQNHSPRKHPTSKTPLVAFSHNRTLSPRNSAGIRTQTEYQQCRPQTSATRAKQLGKPSILSKIKHLKHHLSSLSNKQNHRQNQQDLSKILAPLAKKNISKSKHNSFCKNQPSRPHFPINSRISHELLPNGSARRTTDFFWTKEGGSLWTSEWA